MSALPLAGAWLVQSAARAAGRRAFAASDVFTKIEMCRAHYRDLGLGVDYVDRFVR